MSVIAVIPARRGSTRFPGKPLAPLLGEPMVSYVARAAARAERIDRVVVATDDPEIAEAGRAAGVEAFLTEGDHATGTDRVAEVIEQTPASLVINLQGDVPLLEPHEIDALVAAFDDPEVEMATLGVRGATREELDNPRAAKIVVDDRQRALYFSRAPVPFRHVDGGVSELAEGEKEPNAWVHVGIYGFRRATLERFVAEPRQGLEEVEDLEQLRALRLGFKIQVVEVAAVPLGVDVPADLRRVESVLRERSEGVAR